jgi:hypothetical protein
LKFSTYFVRFSLESVFERFESFEIVRISDFGLLSGIRPSAFGFPACPVIPTPNSA